MINYLKGNALEPNVDGKKIIVHCCNDVGGWGAGFVVAISKKWKQPEREYRAMSPSERRLGNVQLVVVEDNVTVANLIGQRDIKSNSYNVPPVRYGAIEQGLKKIAEWAESTNASIHMPRIGCGLSGGKWSIMEKVIESAIGDNVPVYVYDFEDKKSESYIPANIE